MRAQGLIPPHQAFGLSVDALSEIGNRGHLLDAFMDKGMKERDKLIIENGVLIFRMEDRRQVWLVIVSPQIDV